MSGFVQLTLGNIALIVARTRASVIREPPGDCCDTVKGDGLSSDWSNDYSIPQPPAGQRRKGGPLPVRSMSFQCRSNALFLLEDEMISRSKNRDGNEF